MSGYVGSVGEFRQNGEKVINDLIAYGRTYCVLREQGRAWRREVEIFHTALGGVPEESRLYFE